MKHKKWVDHIHLLRHGELNSREQKALNNHLNDCPDCRVVYEQLQLDWVSVIGELSGDPEISAPEALTDSIMDNIELQPTRVVPGKPSVLLDKLSFVYSGNVKLGLQVATLALLAIFLIEQYEVTNSVRILENRLQKQGRSSTQARMSILPERFKTRLLEGLKNQLNQRGLPSKRIEVVLNNLEMEHPVLEFWNKELSVRRQDQELSIIKRMQKKWRQP